MAIRLIDKILPKNDAFVGMVDADQIIDNFADIALVIDGGGSEIADGIKGDLEIPFNCTINSWTLLADQSGSIVIDIWKDTYANFPPTNADAMPGAGKEPTLTTATNSQDTTVTDWDDYTIDAGDILRFNVDSCTTITRVTLSLKVTKL